MQKNDNTPIARLWIVFFLYTAAVSLVIQLVILPYITPAWHAGDGLLTASYDARLMHRLALEMAQKIQDAGWSAWELRPYQQAPSGIASIFYSIIAPKPWTLIPLNAAVHATSAIMLLRIAQIFIPHWRSALLAALPFFLYLTPATWYAQMHRDGYSILGFYLFLYGYCIFFKNDKSIAKRELLPILFYVAIGVFICWISRPYLTTILHKLSIFAAFIGTIVFLFKWRKNIMPSRAAFSKILIVLSLIFVIYPFTKSKGATEVITTDTKEFERIQHALKGEKSSWEKSSWEKSSWEKSSWMPASADNIFYSLSTMRLGMASLSGKADIDKNIQFSSASEVIAHMPRALQIVFLAPFPYHWTGEGSHAATTLMRRIVMLETIGIYLSLIFVPYALWKWRKRMEIWVIFIFCSAIMLLYGIVFVNVGSIQRIRYGYMMAIVAVGILGMVTFFDKHLTQRKEQ